MADVTSSQQRSDTTGKPEIDRNALAIALHKKSRRFGAYFWIPMVWLIIVAIACIFAPFWGLPPADEIDWSYIQSPPVEGHPLGTDNLGRDMWTRLVYGARNTIGIAFITTCLCFFVGIIGGFFAAVLGGWVDNVTSRLVDILMSIPTLIFSLMLLTIFGTSVPVLIAIIALLDSTRVFRLARAVAMNITVLDFVEVAKLRGEGLWWIMRKEILPNAMPPLVAEFGLRFCFVFLFISALSFLGLGLQPPTADWGSMVKDNAVQDN